MARILFSQLRGAHHHSGGLHTGTFPLSTKSPLVTSADSSKVCANGQADPFTATGRNRSHDAATLCKSHGARERCQGLFYSSFSRWSLSNRGISSGEHARFFAVENVLPVQMHEAAAVREAKHWQHGDLTGVAELEEGLRSFCRCNQCPTHCLLLQLRSCCWAHKSRVCLLLCCAEQGHLCGPKDAHLNSTDFPGSNVLDKI